MWQRRVLAVVPLVVSFAALAGCGPKARPVAHLSGKVMFKGKLVPAGFINFMPDVTAGNAGEVKAFPIVNGAYNTADGSSPGVYPGANKVTISGFDGQAVRLWPKGKQIFNPVELNETVPTGTNTRDFEVPASAGQNVQVVPTADPD